MRFVHIAAILLGLSGPAAMSTAQEAVTLERVWPGYRDAASFTRLGEYFGEGPDQTNQRALRSQPDARAGFYWLIRARSAATALKCSVILEVRRAGRTHAEMHTFPTELGSDSHAFHVGLTGADWPNPDERPVAWRLTLQDTDGNNLGSEQSFLW